jgi:hypothetical protein
VERGAEDAARKIAIVGEIDVTTLVDFTQAIDEARAEGVKSVLVELESPGGSLTSAMAIGELVRESGFDTGVAERGKCYSACVLILAAGVKRSVATGKVGVHRPYYDRGLHSPDRPALTEGEYGQVVTGDVQRYFDKMGMRDGLMDAMMKVPSKFMRHLTSREVAVYGLDNTVPCKIVEPVVAADTVDETPPPVVKPNTIRKFAEPKSFKKAAIKKMKKKQNVAKRNGVKSSRQVLKLTGPWGRVAAVPSAKRSKRQVLARS